MTIKIGGNKFDVQIDNESLFKIEEMLELLGNLNLPKKLKIL